MKVLLNNEKEYQVSIVTPYTENELCIGFINVTSYDKLRKELTPEALSVIKFYSNDDIENFVTYEDYTEFTKANVTNNEDGTLDIVMYFRKADATTKAIQEMQRQIAKLEEKNKNLQETVDTLVLDNLEE